MKRALTDKQVADARRLVASGTATVAELARQMGVRYTTLKHAVRGTTHRSLNPVAAPVTARPGQRQARLSEEKVAQARRDARQGRAISAIADTDGVPYNTVWAAVTGGSWQGVNRVEPPVPPRPPRKLTRQEVAAARRAYRRNEATIAQLARRYGVGWNTMQRAILGVTYPEANPLEPPVTRAGMPLPPAAEEAAVDRRRLTPKRVAAARRAVAAGRATIADLARRYGVSESALSAAVHGLTWKHVKVPPVPAGQPGRPGTIQQHADEIRAARARGESMRAIAARLGVAPSGVSRFLAKETLRNSSR